MIVTLRARVRSRAPIKPAEAGKKIDFYTCRCFQERAGCNEVLARNNDCRFTERLDGLAYPERILTRQRRRDWRRRLVFRCSVDLILAHPFLLDLFRHWSTQLRMSVASHASKRSCTAARVHFPAVAESSHQLPAKCPA